MLFSFNLYSALLLIGFVQGTLFCGLLLQRAWRESRLADGLLGILLLICCLRISQYMLGFAGWYDSHDAYSTFMFYFPFHNLLLFGPVVYFYFLSVTNQQFRLERKHLWHFVPGMLYLLFFALIFLHDVVAEHWVGGQIFPYFYGTKGEHREWWEVHLSGGYNNFSILHILVYLLLTLRNYQLYQRYLVEHFSNTEHISFRWLAVMLYAILLGLGVVLLIGFYSSFIQDLSYSQYWLSHFTLAVMVYFVSLVGYQQNERLHQQLAFEPAEPEIIKDTPARDETFPELEEWKAKVLQKLAEEHIYLQAQLSLPELAEQLSTNTSHLSRVINLGFGMNFNDLINHWRVEAVKERMQDDRFAHLTLFGIALDCGFNSKATFNRAFRKFSGQSPREYMQQLNPTVGQSKP